jgi:hypothetical protein
MGTFLSKNLEVLSLPAMLSADEAVDCYPGIEQSPCHRQFLWESLQALNLLHIPKKNR